MDPKSTTSREELQAVLLAKAEQDPQFRTGLMTNPAAVLERELGSPEAAHDFLKGFYSGGSATDEELSEDELDNVTGGSLLSSIKVWLMGNKSKFVNDGSGGVAGVRG
jgi:bacteriocin-like protein